MSEAAFHWWYGIEDEAVPEPQLDSPHDMAFIWNRISPLLLATIDSLIEGNEYWESVHSIFKRYFSDENVPSPITDISSFVLYLFERKSMLKLDNIENCTRYINAFYTDNLQDFFLCQFVYAIAEPTEIFRLFYIFHTEKHPIWVKFLESKGAIERIIDLFISFLVENPFDDDPGDLRVDLAAFMTDIVVENDYVPNLAEQTIKNIYTKIAAMLKKSNDNASVTFFRCLVRLNQRWLKHASAEEKSSRLKKILDSTQDHETIRGIALNYIHSHAGTSIEYRKIVNTIIKFDPTDVGYLKEICNCAKEGDENTRYLALRFFAKLMISHKILMRVSTMLFIEIIESYDEVTEEIKWIPQFIKTIFCFMKLALNKNKYKNRIVQICSIFSSGIFDHIPWIKNEILESASSLLAYDYKLTFLTYFFNIKPQNPDRIEKIVTKFENQKINLKCFPFRPNSLLFLEGLNLKRPKLSISSQDLTASGILQNMELRPQSLKFITLDYDLSKLDHLHNIQDIEEFITQAENQLNEINEQAKEKNYPDPNNYKGNYKFIIQSHNAILRDTYKRIQNYQRFVCTEFIEIANEIIRASQQNRYIVANTNSMSKLMQSLLFNTSEYNTMKKEKAQISIHAIKVYTEAKKYLNDSPARGLKSAVYSGLRSINTKLQYLARSDVDDAIVPYFASHLKGKDADLVKNIKDCDAGHLVSDVYAMSFVVTEDIGGDRSNENYVPIISSAMFRFAFDLAYDETSILNSRKSDDERFLKLCTNILNIDLNNVNLRAEIIRKICVFKTVRGLLSSCHHDLGAISYLTNPIDIAYEIHRSVCQVPILANCPSVTGDESALLLLFMIAKVPPANSVSICCFLKKFEPVVSSLELLVSMNTYSRAIELAFQMEI